MCYLLKVADDKVDMVDAIYLLKIEDDTVGAIYLLKMLALCYLPVYGNNEHIKLNIYVRVF